MIYFLIGFKIRQCGVNYISKVSPFGWLAIHVLLFFFVTNQHGFNGIIFKVVNMGLTIVLKVVGSIMAFMVLQAIARLVNWNNSSLFKEFTSKYMTIYLLHQQIIYFTKYIGLMESLTHILMLLLIF